MTTQRIVSRDGVTLIELVVVIAILGIVASVSLLAWPREVSTRRRADSFAVLLQSARQSAIDAGLPQRLRLRMRPDGSIQDSAVTEAGSFEVNLVALPDGSVLADSSLGIPRVGGHLEEAARGSKRLPAQ